MKIMVNGIERIATLEEEEAIVEQQKTDREASRPTIEMIKVEAARRIEAIMPMWMIAREISGGTPISDEIKAEVQLIRDASNQLEAKGKIPFSYTDDKYWT